MIARLNGTKALGRVDENRLRYFEMFSAYVVSKTVPFSLKFRGTLEKHSFFAYVDHFAALLFRWQSNFSLHIEQKADFVVCAHDVCVLCCVCVCIACAVCCVWPSRVWRG